jgi:hypothetical protein
MFVVKCSLENLVGRWRNGYATKRQRNHKYEVSQWIVLATFLTSSFGEYKGIGISSHKVKVY